MERMLHESLSLCEMIRSEKGDSMTCGMMVRDNFKFIYPSSMSSFHSSSVLFWIIKKKHATKLYKQSSSIFTSTDKNHLHDVSKVVKYKQGC